MEKVNLIYIFADQWRYQALGNQKEDQVLTPCMDIFSTESMNFSNAYSTFPLCSPHRASLMTGKYPYSVGMWTNCKTGLEEKIMLKPQEICIGNVLKENGYSTGYIGKWHLDSSEQNFIKEPKSGAKNWDAYTPPGERRQGFDYWLSYGADDEHLDPHYWENTEKQIKPKKWSAEFETDKAIEFIQNRKDKNEPFALFLSYNPPHLPYELVPDEYYEKFKNLKIKYRKNVPENMMTEDLETKTRQYFAAVYGIDKQFARIYTYLKENNLEENTILVLSADHGEMLGSHSLMSKNIWYEESIHIPLIIRQKGKINPKENDVIFASPDHMPTILSLLDLPIPKTCEGYNHKNSILGDNDKNVPEDMFLCSYPGGADMVKKFEKMGLNHKCYGWRGIKTKENTYIVNNGYNPDEEQIELLYDDINDKYQLNPKKIEKNNDDKLVLELKDKLKQYLAKINDPFLI